MKKIIPSLSLIVILTGCHNKADYDATGIFEATTVTVSSETTGKILRLDVAEGDNVNQGQLLASIDTSMLVLQRSQLLSRQGATANTTPDIQAQAAALRTQIANQELEFKRQKNLLADGATTQQRYDNAASHLQALKDQLTALLSTLGKNTNSISDNVQAIEIERDQIELQLEKSSVTSPLSGTILVKYAEPGEYAVPGKPLVKIADLNDIYLRSYFTASQLADLNIGQEVTVIADFGGDEQFEYPGTITWIAEESEFTPKTIQTKDSRANLVYAVKVAVKNDGRLKLGQYGEVRL